MVVLVFLQHAFFPFTTPYGYAVMHPLGSVQVLYKHVWGGWGAGGLTRNAYIAYKHFRGGGGVQNLGKHAYIILERSLIVIMGVCHCARLG